jgi:hypothetical protein
MNMRKFYPLNRWLIAIVLALIVILTACNAAPPKATLTPIPPTATPIPPTNTPLPSTHTPVPPTPTTQPTVVTVPLLSKPPELILAGHKPYRNTSYPNHMVYWVPDMDKVLLAFELKYYGNLLVDIYYPPNYQFDTKLPIVILAHGFEDLPTESDKDMEHHMDWAKLIAASGMIAISAQAGNAPVENSYRVFDFLAANADFLGIDLTRIGFWACSGQGEPVFQALQKKNLAYRDGFKAGVFTYLDLTSADPSLWPQNLSLFVVKAMNDQYVSGSTMDNFVSQARLNNIQTEYIELADAPHSFDGELNTQASKDTIKQEIEFFKSKLLP